MFSYLRPHHRRAPSNPTSPADQAHSPEPLSPLELSLPSRYQDTNEYTTALSPAPSNPALRVPAAESYPDSWKKGSEKESKLHEPLNGHTRPRDAKEVNGTRRPRAGTQGPDSAGNVGPTSYPTAQQQPRQLASTDRDASRTFEAMPEVRSRPVLTGRRATGTRMPSPPPALSSYSTFEPAPQRSGKTRLNLLNPMSLLARRRSSQAVAQLAPESLVSRKNGNRFSENFDPRIRGTKVHDFSAPRQPNRNLKSPARTRDVGITSKQYQRSPNIGLDGSDDNASSPWSGGNHTPVFTENFEEEQYPAAGPHVRKASDLTDLPLPKPPYAKSAQKPIDPKGIEGQKQAETGQIASKPSVFPPPPNHTPPPPTEPPKTDGVPVELRRISIDPSSTPPKSSSQRTRPRGVSEASTKDGLPKHMKSTSSRFSFDMIGAAKQEKILEERHRQRALEKEAEKANEDEEPINDFEDDYDYDDMMDDDGIEEEIPLVGDDFMERDPYNRGGLEEITMAADDLEEQPYDFAKDDENLAGFTFQTSPANSLSPNTPMMVSTPRDANGDVIGFALSKLSPRLPQDSLTPTSPIPSQEASAVEGLGLHNVFTLSPITEMSPEPEVREFPRPISVDNDDLYFDDGIIAGPGDDSNDTEFDESVFDNIDTDEYGRPLQKMSSLPTLYEPPMLGGDPGPALKETSKPVDANDIMEAIRRASVYQSPTLAPQPSISERPRSERPDPQPSISEQKPGSMAPPPLPILTQDTLMAYQSALAEAAFTAAANGKFRRDSTIPDPSPSEEDVQPGLVNDSGQTSHYEPFSPSYELQDDFDYDDVLEDDPIIAAANAEALANDCDGFYGQEFGFYSAPAASEAEYIHGGYFGPRGNESMLRSQSGRVASREPNLTPITERSEYSNRNSLMFSPMYGPGGIPISSPGLSQLAGMLRSPGALDGEGDMSMDALMRARNRAWGGSQASLRSGDGSPRSAGGLGDVKEQPPWETDVAIKSSKARPVHRRNNSTFSIGSELETGKQSASSSAPASPTLTMSNLVLASPLEEKEDREARELIKKDKHTISTESISYLKEDDLLSPTGERWILERRRTGEAGEVEVLGREVISGGRI